MFSYFLMNIKLKAEKVSKRMLIGSLNKGKIISIIMGIQRSMGTFRKRKPDEIPTMLPKYPDIRMPAIILLYSLNRLIGIGVHIKKTRRKGRIGDPRRFRRCSIALIDFKRLSTVLGSSWVNIMLDKDSLYARIKELE